MDSELNIKEKTISGLKWTALSKLITQLFTWASTLIVIRVLTPEDYGLMSLASILINFLTLLYEMGLGSALIQAKSITEKDIKNVFGFIIVINLTLFIISFSLALPIADFFKSPEAIPLIQVLSFKFILVAFSVIPSSLLLREMRFKTKSLIDMMANLFGSVATLALALFGYGVWSLVLGSFAISVSSLISLYVVNPYFEKPSFNFKPIKKMMYFGGIVTFERILWFSYTQADNIIIGKILGKESLGLYSVAMELSSLPMQKLNGIINQVAFPAFAKIQNSKDQLLKAMSMSIHYIALVSFPIFFGLSISANEFIPLLLGEKWQSITIPIMILSLNMPIRMISNIFPTFLRGIGKPAVSLLNLMIYSIVLPFGFYIGGSMNGMIGICLVWLLVYPFVFTTELVLTFKSAKIPLPIFFRETYEPAFASVFMVLIIFYVKYHAYQYTTNPTIVLSLELITGILVYTSIIIKMRRNVANDLIHLLKGK